MVGDVASGFSMCLNCFWIRSQNWCSDCSRLYTISAERASGANTTIFWTLPPSLFPGLVLMVTLTPVWFSSLIAFHASDSRFDLDPLISSKSRIPRGDPPSQSAGSSAPPTPPDLPRRVAFRFDLNLVLDTKWKVMPNSGSVCAILKNLSSASSFPNPRCCLCMSANTASKFAFAVILGSNRGVNISLSLK